jgi:hypothetical protein
VLKKTATEMFEILKIVHSEESISYPERVFGWHERFKAGLRK